MDFEADGIIEDDSGNAAQPTTFAEVGPREKLELDRDGSIKPGKDKSLKRSGKLDWFCCLLKAGFEFVIMIDNPKGSLDRYDQAIADYCGVPYKAGRVVPI